MTRSLSRLLLTTALLCIALQGLAASLHVIPRPDAKAMIPKIKPFLGPGGIVEAYKGKLIIKTDDANFARIQTILNKTSGPPESVTIYLRRDATSGAQHAGANVNDQGITIIGGKRQRHTHSRFSVNTLAGYAAGISRGKLIALIGSIDGKPALTNLKRGISVTPFVLGNNQVRLLVHQEYDSPRGKSADTQHASSTLRLTPGKWQPMGSIQVQQASQASDLQGVSQDSKTLVLPLDVKVVVNP